jgi:hypothetical protein
MTVVDAELEGETRSHEGWVWPWYVGSDVWERGVSLAYFGPRGYAYSSDFTPVVVEVNELARSIVEADSSGGGLPGWELASSVPVYGPMYVMPRWDVEQFDRLMKRLCKVVGPGPDWGTVAARLSRYVSWDYDYRYDEWLETHFGEPYNPHLWPEAFETGAWMRRFALSQYGQKPLGVSTEPVNGVYEVVIDRCDGEAWASLICGSDDHLSLVTSGVEGMVNHCDDQLRDMGVQLLGAASTCLDELVPRYLPEATPQPQERRLHVLTTSGWLQSTEPFPAGAESLAGPVSRITDRIQQLTTVAW